MLKERFQEVFDFTKSESPYRKANKGWINQDIFLDFSPPADKINQINEDAKVTLFWSPINKLLSNIFIIIILGTVLVFTSASFAKGTFYFDLFSNSSIVDVVEIEENNSLDIVLLEDINSTNSTTPKNLETKELDKINKISSLDDDSNEEDEKIINKKIEKEDSLNKESESNKDIKILQNKKPKSNFI